MNILIFSFDPAHFPCARLRLLDPLVSGLGYEARYGLVKEKKGYVYHRPLLSWADVIVVQRGFPKKDMWFICEEILASGKPVVYETDDCLPEIPDFHQKEHYRQAGDFIKEMARRAHLVTVSTAPLQAYFLAYNSQVKILPNYLNDHFWRRPERDFSAHPDEVRIGYIGNRGHRGDIADKVPLFAHLHRTFPQTTFYFIGTMPEAMKQLDRTFDVESNFNYAGHPERMAALQLDIAIAPLAHHPFNACISNLKFLEYSALSIAGVYEDFAPYAGTVVHGVNGFLCNTPEDWRATLELLVNDCDARESVARRAHQSVNASWMLSGHLDLWRETYAALAGKAAR